MKLNRVRNNMIVRNKVTGEHYELAVTKTPSGVANVLAVPIDPETNEPIVDAPGISINESNAICFRILKDPDPKDIIDMAELDVEDGIIKFRGENLITTQGDIVAIDIIATTRDFVIFTAESKSEDKVDIMTYEVSRDRFAVVASVPEQAEKLNVRTNETAAYIYYSSTVLENGKDEDGKDTTIARFIGGAIITIVDGRKRDTVKFYEPTELVDYIEDDKGNSYAILKNTATVDEDNVIVDTRDDCTVVSFDSDGNNVDYMVKDYIVKSVINTYTETTDFSRVYVGENVFEIAKSGIRFESPVIEPIVKAGCLYIVDYKRTKDGDELTLSNADTSIVNTVTRVFTHDRGVLYSVA